MEKQTKIIEFNVGGVPYTTTMDTLKQDEDGLLFKLASGKIGITMINNAIFIDRDGKLFRHVIDYLRNTTTWTIPKKVDTEALIREADFFGLVGMKRILEHKEESIDEANDSEWVELRKKHPMVSMRLMQYVDDRKYSYYVYVPGDGPGDYNQFKDSKTPESYEEAMDIITYNLNEFFKIGYRLKAIQPATKDHEYISYIFETKD